MVLDSGSIYFSPEDSLLLKELASGLHKFSPKKQVVYRITAHIDSGCSIMGEELIGFVTGNNNRQKLLTLLASKGGMGVEHIAKRMRLVAPAVAKMVSELEEKGLLEGKDGLYTLTEEGLSVERRIQSL